MPKAFSKPADYSEKEYVAIPMTAVTSNQIAAVGYSPERKTLAVTFTRGTGAVYHYPNCDQQVHTDFMAAESKGKFFGERIKSLPFNKFPAPVEA
ncbi:hypothetical protein D3C87_1079080 [compost metagenome]